MIAFQKIPSLSVIVHYWTGKCDRNDCGYLLFFFFFLPDTFSTDNSFHGRLASDLILALPFSLFNLGRGSEGDVFLAGQQCEGKIPEENTSPACK